MRPFRARCSSESLASIVERGTDRILRREFSNVVYSLRPFLPEGSEQFDVTALALAAIAVVVVYHGCGGERKVVERLWTERQIERALGWHSILPTKINPRNYADAREVPRYSVAEVALYLHLKPRTVHSWFFGRAYATSQGKTFWNPVAIPAAHDPHGYSLSFFNLAEAHVLASTRKDFNISMKSIRFAMNELVKKYASAQGHPLLSKDFETDGCDLFIRELAAHGEEVVLNLNKPDQLGLKEMMDGYLKRIVRDARYMPTKVFPVVDHDMRDRTIVISQGVAAGRPTIAGTGIRASAVWNRYKAGETEAELADDYGVNEQEIKKAITYFSSLRAA